jgi:hypothetical protein
MPWDHIGDLRVQYDTHHRGYVVVDVVAKRVLLGPFASIDHARGFAESLATKHGVVVERDRGCGRTTGATNGRTRRPTFES